MSEPKPPLAAIEFAQFLKDHEFTLAADLDGSTHSYTVFRNPDILLAFAYERHDGENVVVAPLGSPATIAALSSRSDGWQLVGSVLPDIWTEFHKARRSIRYPHDLGRTQETALVENALRRLMGVLIKGPNISVNPDALKRAGYLRR
jgi:hypothetical protein